MNISLIELIFIDVVPADQEPNYDYRHSVLKEVAPFLRTRIIGCKSGFNLPQKLIQLTQSLYDLSVTSITNIPMKVKYNVHIIKIRKIFFHFIT